MLAPVTCQFGCWKAVRGFDTAAPLCIRDFSTMADSQTLQLISHVLGNVSKMA